MMDTERGYLIMTRLTDDKRAYSRRAQLRARLLAKAPIAMRNLKGAARKAAMNQLEAEHNRLRKWVWQFDHVLGTQDREAFKLYRAAVKLRAIQLRAARDYDTARMLDAHLNTLHDVAPRAAWCYYPAEWREISRALRPFNDKPPSGTKAAKLYAIYQRIRSQRQVEAA